jgi:hypothetical protein
MVGRREGDRHGTGRPGERDGAGVERELLDIANPGTAPRCGRGGAGGKRRPPSIAEMARLARLVLQERLWREEIKRPTEVIPGRHDPTSAPL